MKTTTKKVIKEGTGISRVSTQAGSSGDEPKQPTSDPTVMNLRLRLQRLNRRHRFSEPANLRSVAALWACDYVNQVFPMACGAEKIRLLLSAETGFIASSELTRLGLKEWQRLVNDGQNAKQDFPDI